MRALAVNLSPSSSLSLKVLGENLRRDPVMGTLPSILFVAGTDNVTSDETGYSTLFSNLRHLDLLYLCSSSMSPSADWMLKVGPAVGHTLS